jgi:hypothetical protein
MQNKKCPLPLFAFFLLSLYLTLGRKNEKKKIRRESVCLHFPSYINFALLSVSAWTSSYTFTLLSYFLAVFLVL